MNTKRFMYQVLLNVEIEAFDEDDAAQAIEDCFGEGSFCGLEVQAVEVLDFEELV
jgi:hypothetical protein